MIRYKTEGSNSPALASAESRALTEEDTAAGVTSDRVGYFMSENAVRTRASKILLREVVIHSENEGKEKWQVAAGAATLDEIMPILRERERQNDLARRSAAARLAKKKAQQQ